MFVKVSDFKQFKSLSVVQLSTSYINTVEYISGPLAIQQNLISVEEINKAGDVNRLKVTNLSPHFIFFMDSDILSGAKQNRVLNTSVFLHPKSKCIIPVSCVEQGRWSHKSAKFSETQFTAPNLMRAKKARDVKENLKEFKMYDSDQGEVWKSVEDYRAAFSVESKTSNLGDVLESKENDFESIIKEFIPNEESNGLAIFIGGKLLNIDIFNRADIYKEYFGKLIKAAAMDAAHLATEKLVTRSEAEYKTLSFLDLFDELDFEVHQGVAEGKEKRFNRDELTGFELSYKDLPIHLAALSLK